MRCAYSIRVKGVVQGVGFRPFVYRIASARRLCGWVRNGEQGVEIFIEGDASALSEFVLDLQSHAPPAAHIAEVQVESAVPQTLDHFTIESSIRSGRATVPVSPDLAVCEQCLRELFDPADRRYHYPYINCTNCGPRYSVIRKLPYDRPFTTMAEWPLDAYCRREYENPANRRFHAQPVACPECGPTYFLQHAQQTWKGAEAVVRAAALLREGLIVAVKGLGGYHLACDARNVTALLTLRERKFRKEKAFAVMAADLAAVHEIADLSDEARYLLTGVARPVVLLPAKLDLPGVAPENRSLGVMLP
ncbi:MAG TPA: acylphosphatase, partial [Terriglobales bacterium]